MFQTFYLETIETNIDIQNLVDINENDASFTVVFNISMNWHDHRIQFNFLKENPYKNLLNSYLEGLIWTPKITLRLTAPSNIQYIFISPSLFISVSKEEISKQLMVLKSSEPPRLSADNYVLRVNETYSGKSNPFQMEIWYQENNLNLAIKILIHTKTTFLS